MARNAKPIDLHLVQGNPNRLTKAEIARRKATQIKIKNRVFKASPEVMADPRALKEFNRLKKLYKEIEFVASLDEHIINQYCLSVSELDDLVSMLNIYREKMKKGSMKTKEKALDAFMKIDVEIRMKRQEIVRLSDRLYLNPVARTKNVPKKEPEKPQTKFDKKFGDV